MVCFCPNADGTHGSEAARSVELKRFHVGQAAGPHTYWQTSKIYNELAPCSWARAVNRGQACDSAAHARRQGPVLRGTSQELPAGPSGRGCANTSRPVPPTGWEGSPTSTDRSPLWGRQKHRVPAERVCEHTCLLLPGLSGDQAERPPRGRSWPWALGR